MAALSVETATAGIITAEAIVETAKPKRKGQHKRPNKGATENLQQAEPRPKKDNRKIPKK